MMVHDGFVVESFLMILKKDWNMCTDCLKVRAAEVALADSYESVRTSSLYVHQTGFCHPQDHRKNQPNLQMNFVKILCHFKAFQPGEFDCELPQAKA